ncbi:MAG TPA: serine/threonine-protein kinase [Gemmataceae bacterium]|nr:serine/threonine-protein kinase [Gemmataceae bacterium]
MPPAPSETNCPAPEVWREFALGRLKAADRDHLATHLTACTQCQLRLSAQSKSVSERPSGSPTERARLNRTEEGAADTAEGSARIANHSPLPKQLGPYEILELVNSGGMGNIYYARHTRLNRIVALKTLQPHRLNDSLMQARFDREMQASGMLADHPNLVRATDANEDAGIHFLVMDFIAGENVHRLSQRAGPLRVADACEIVRQAALGLAYIHSCGLVHRDCKPSNLMVTPDGVVKVLDLGLARLPLDHDDDGALTGAWTVVGTPDFMSPEQIFDAHRVGPAADLYSLGCTLFQLLTGRPTFEGPDCTTRAHKFKAHTMQPPPALSDFRADIPPELSNLVQRLLAKDPKDRPASARNLVEELEPFCRGHDLPKLVRESAADGGARSTGSETPQLAADTLSLRTANRSARRRRQRWMGAVGCLVVLVGLGFLGRPLWSNLFHRERGEEAEPAVVSLEHYEPDQYYHTFKHEPKPIIWGNPGNSKVFWNPHGDALTSTFSGPQGLLKCGDMQAKSFTLDVAMFQANWGGQTGIFFGFEGEKQNGEWVKWSYEAIMVEPNPPLPPPKPGTPQPPPPKFRYGLIRTYFRGERNGNGFAIAPAILAADGIADPENHEYTLSIRCQDNFLTDVRWNGQPLEKLTDRVVKSPFPRQYKGQFGTFQSENTTTFRQFRFMLFKEGE